MATHTTTSGTTLTLTRTFSATPEKVFGALTDPKELMRWFAPSDDFSTPIAEVDLRVGGKYRIQMKAPDGETHTVGGTYREVVPPEKLVFTFAWEDGKVCGGDSLDLEMLVTVLLQAKSTTTELTLIHEGFPNSEIRDKHNQGWNGCLARLPKVV